jgi:hypothetical protein
MVAGWWQEGVRTDTDRAEDAGMGLQRIRTIKPEFFVHEDLARVSFAGRLLYIGLWTVADCVGRLEDRPTRLKALLFPYDAVDVDALLADLATRGFIRRYQADGHACIDIPTFLKHQRPGPRELAHELPPCGEVQNLFGSFAKDSSSRAPAGTGTGTGSGTGREREGVLSLSAPAARQDKSPTLRTKPKTPWPEDLVLTDTLAAYATRQGLDARYQWGKFHAHALRDDVRHVNWVRAWEYWVRNAWEFEQRHA